ncbi:MAG: hypothetical protein RLZZ630_810 [Bacteroidota bacterium]
MKKVLLITNVPTPYRIPLFERMNKSFKEIGWELTVVFGERSYQRRKYTLDEKTFDFKHIFINGGQKNDSTNPEATVFLYSGVLTLLRKKQPDHVIVSGFSPATLRVWWWSLTKGGSFSIWSGTIPRRGQTFGLVRTSIRKLMASRANGFIAYGHEAKRYLSELGVPDHKIDIATNTVDTTYFRENAGLHRDQSASEKTSPFTFTYIGYLVPRKQVDKILYAAAKLAQQRGDFRIRIIGDGSERKALESLSVELMVSDMVGFEGHKQTSELPAILAATNVFLFQTGFDIWGLVLNEAMAAGVACIASIHGGATTDLIQDGLNGFRMDFNDTEALTEKMKWCIDHPSEVRSMGIRASEDVEHLAGMDKAVRIFITNTLKSSKKKA